MKNQGRRQYLLLDKRCRRYSAPDDLRLGFSKSYTSEESEDDSKVSKVSVLDLSILFEDGSDSSLELDTSYSRCATPVPSTSRPRTATGCYSCKESQQIAKSSVWITPCSRAAVKTLVLAQIMSICVSIIDQSTSTLLSNSFHLSVPSQNLPLYLYMGLAWTTQLALRGGSRGLFQVLRLSGLRYIFLAVLHVEATSVAISSLGHDTFIGNQMIDCTAASISFIIAFVCLEVEYKGLHVIGFALAFTGAVGMCAANTTIDSDSDDAPIGDILRFGSGLFLCFNSLAQELIVKSIDNVEYLGMIGLIGSFFCGIKAIVLDTNTPIPTNCPFWCSLIIFSCAQFIFCCSAPKVLRDVGATGMHLSLMTSSFYFRLIQNFFTSGMFQGLHVISYLLVIGGCYVFIFKRTAIGKHYFYPVQVTLPKH